MEPKTCQNQREACHNKVGPNPFDLCNECLFFNALLDLRFYAKDLKSYIDEHVQDECSNVTFMPDCLLDSLRDWFKYRPKGSEQMPAEFTTFVEAKDGIRGSATGTLLALEAYLLKQMPKTMRDNQEDCSTILNLI